MVDVKAIEKAKEHFGKILEEQMKRVDAMKAGQDWTDYGKLKSIKIGICGGDGIGPYISESAQMVLEDLLRDEIKAGKVEIKVIEGLTIENRVKVMKAIPDDVLVEIKECDVVLKGPTTTPKKGDPWPNIESANVAMRRELDLFANVRPVKVPELGVDWMFFRENTEGSYVLGSRGVNVTDDLAIDFCVATSQGSDRIIRLAFEHARKNGIAKVSVVTKANVVKTTDGKFLAIAAQVAKDYPGIQWDDWFIDIMTAKLIDPYRRKDFKVIVLPNLYGDILTDEAAQIQGGVGTAGSANIGKMYAMFEAIHQRGSLPVQNVSAQELATFYGGHGVDPTRFVEALRSEGVNEKLKAARSFALNAGVRGTPNLVVNGKYLVKGSSFEDMLRITDALVARERAALRAR